MLLVYVFDGCTDKVSSLVGFKVNCPSTAASGKLLSN